MGVKIASSSSSVCTSICSLFQSKRTHQVSLPPRLHDRRRLQIGVNTGCSLHGRSNIKQRFPNIQFISSASINDLMSVIESDDNTDQDYDDAVASKRFENVEVSRGRPGIISFYNQPYKKESETVVSTITTTNQINRFWFAGPTVLVASFVFQSLYTRKILSNVFEDYLLAEALFYRGVAVFLFTVDYLHGLNEPVSAKNSPIPSKLTYRATYVVALVLSLVMIPVITMGLVGSWPDPLAYATPYNLAINGSLSMLLNVLQCLGVICTWSLSNFLMRILPSITPIINFVLPHTTKDKSWWAHIRSIIILLLNGLI